MRSRVVFCVRPLALACWARKTDYTNARSLPEPVSGGPASVGRFERFALRTSYPLIRTRKQTFTVTGAFEYINQKVALPLFATDLNRDRYGVLRTGVANEAG